MDLVGIHSVTDIFANVFSDLQTYQCLNLTRTMRKVSSQPRKSTLVYRLLLVAGDDGSLYNDI